MRKKLYKYIDEYHVEIEKNVIFLPNHIIIANPTEKTLRELGFTDLVETTETVMPLTEDMIQVPHYTLKNGIIYKSYTYEECGDYEKRFI